MECPNCHTHGPKARKVEQLQELDEGHLRIDFTVQCKSCGAIFQTFAEYTLDRECIAVIDSTEET